MKIAITGKGGVGKTTICALLARAWVRAGYQVLAIDADPVGGLAGALGFPKSTEIIPLSEMSELIEARTGAKPGTLGQLFKLNPKVDDLPAKIASEHNGIKLIVMGGIKSGGGGCACPESTLIKALIRHIILERDDYVIMDMEAGVEHLGRGTAEAVDLMIIVVEPSLRSIQTAHQIKRLAQEIGIKNIKAIGNKIRTREDKEFIQHNLAEIKVIGFIPFDNEMIAADKKGVLAIESKSVIDEITGIKTALGG